LRSLLAKNPVRIVREICGLTQAQLADIIGCARLTIHTLESGKLKLSQKMTEQISLFTGVSQAWLLDPNRKLPPTCERDPQRPYTQEVFTMTQKEISDPRAEPMDVVVITAFVHDAYRRLYDAAWQAYDQNRIIYFNLILAKFLKELGQRWPHSRQIPATMTVAEITSTARALFEKTRQKKERSKSRK